jgi:hypothetical protein
MPLPSIVNVLDFSTYASVALTREQMLKVLGVQIPMDFLTEASLPTRILPDRTFGWVSIYKLSLELVQFVKVWRGAWKQ